METETDRCQQKIPPLFCGLGPKAEYFETVKRCGSFLQSHFLLHSQNRVFIYWGVCQICNCQNEVNMLFLYSRQKFVAKNANQGTEKDVIVALTEWHMTAKEIYVQSGKNVRKKESFRFLQNPQNVFD